ncbi:MAG: zinc ribbon domain-containing protein [Blautia sp.]|nr:zinc ribbon domain-containing protein [Blautia sp.]
MFCGNCGKQIEDSSNVCPYCGAVVKKEILAGNDNKYAKIFVEPDENYIGSLGDGYINSYLTGKSIKRCIAFLSDKRVYLRGNMIDTNNGKFQRFNMQKTIDLEDITGTGFLYYNPLWKLILAIVLFLFALFIGIPSARYIPPLPVLPIIPAILLIVSYLKGRITLFSIEYAGGCIKFDASIYGLAESQDFEKQIRRAKNNVKGKN